MAKEIKCPWCEEMNLESEITVNHKSNSYGGIVERRCAQCGKVVAAYLEGEGDFLSRIRKF